MEAQLRRRREIPWGIKKRGQRRHQRVSRGRRVRRFFIASGRMESQACARGRLMWASPVLLFHRNHASQGGHRTAQWNDVVRPYDGEQYQVVLVDEWTMTIERQTDTLMATNMTPWIPVATRFALEGMPGEDDSILGSKSRRERLSIDVMKQLGTRLRCRGAVRSAQRRFLPRCLLCRLRWLVSVVWLSQ